MVWKSIVAAALALAAGSLAETMREHGSSDAPSLADGRIIALAKPDAPATVPELAASLRPAAGR